MNRHLVLLILLLQPAPLRAQWGIGGYIGATAIPRTNLTVADPQRVTDVAFMNVKYKGRSFETPLYYGGRIRYMITDQLGVEAEFIHMKIHLDVDQTVQTAGLLQGVGVTQSLPVNTLVQRFEISHGLNFLLGNLVYRQPIRQGIAAADPVALVFRAGLGPTIPHPEFEALGVARDRYEWNRPGYQLALGVEVPIAGIVALAVEYKFTGTNQRYEADLFRLDTEVHAHHLVGGLQFRF